MPRSAIFTRGQGRLIRSSFYPRPSKNQLPLRSETNMRVVPSDFRGRNSNKIIQIVHETSWIETCSAPTFVQRLTSVSSSSFSPTRPVPRYQRAFVTRVSSLDPPSAPHRSRYSRRGSRRAERNRWRSAAWCNLLFPRGCGESYQRRRLRWSPSILESRVRGQIQEACTGRPVKYHTVFVYSFTNLIRDQKSKKWIDRFFF